MKALVLRLSHTCYSMYGFVQQRLFETDPRFSQFMQPGTTRTYSEHPLLFNLHTREFRKMSFRLRVGMEEV